MDHFLLLSGAVTLLVRPSIGVWWGQTRTGMFLGSSVVARGGMRFPAVLTPAGWG